MKAISIMGYYGNHNTGDEAILSALIGSLRERLPETELVVLSGDPGSTSRIYDVSSVSDILPPNRLQHLICQCGRGRKKYRETVQKAISSELLIVGGGGLIFDQPDDNRYLMEFLGKIDYARRSGLAIALLAIGIGPLHHQQSRREVVRVLAQTDLIVVREEKSKALLEKIGLSHPQLHVAGDLGILLQSAEQSLINEALEKNGFARSGEGPVITICLRGKDAARPGLREAVRRLCLHAIEKHKASIWFLPFQYSGGDDDRPGLAGLKNDLAGVQSAYFGDAELSPEQIHGVIGQSDFVVGERFHSLVFATANQKRFIGISYHPKVSRLLEMMGHRDLCVDLEGIEPTSLITNLDRIATHDSSLDESVRKLLDKLKSDAYKNFDQLFAFYNLK